MRRRTRGAVHVSVDKIALAVLAFTLILLVDFIPQFQPKIVPLVQAQGGSDVATLSPVNNWGPFVNTRGDVQINLNKSGVAVRVEIPREFIEANARFGSVATIENETYFIESDIRNDYYYYSLVDESLHWSYAWKGAQDNAPCFKPGFSFYDPNAPWCVEIWNFLNETFYNFTAPRFVRFRNLNAPSIAGVYNFTVFVADRINKTLGYPDFVHSWNQTLRVPVSMKPNPGSINGTIFDCVTGETIKAKGVVYALNSQGVVVAKTYVNQVHGNFSLTGLDRDQTYTVQGSAGMFREADGKVWAFSLTPRTASILSCSGPPAPTPVGVYSLYLRRAPQIWADIKYHDSTDVTDISSQIRALTGHPWLTNIDPNLQVLNVTVEAKNSTSQVKYRNQSLFHDLTQDPLVDSFRIITGAGVKYVGTDPYGTEFAGLPQSGSLELRVWVTGYRMRDVWTVTISPPNTGEPNTGTGIPDNTIWMDSGGVIKLDIRFVHDNSTLLPESPQAAQTSLDIIPLTDVVFGGNIVIKAYNNSGILRAATITNGTLPDGTVRYATRSSVIYYLVGFSEFYNRTWSSRILQPDEGLLEDLYSLNVFVRGYEQVNTPTVQIGLEGLLFETTVYMKRGGAIAVTVQSYNNRFGTRALQSVQPWRFLNLSIPIRARVYFYETSRPIGYVERLMQIGIPNGVSTTYFRVVFGGQNWSLRDIWFSNIPSPTHLTDVTYTIKAFTLGYVQQRDVNIPVSTASVSLTAVALLIGNGIGLIGSLFSAPPPQAIFLTTAEHDHIIAEAYGASSRAGALPGNLSARVATLRLPIFGFGAMVIITFNTTLQMVIANFTGQGHFFYEPPDGGGCVNYGFSQDFNHCFDYGLDVGNYTAQVPEFGFTRHFMQLPAPLYFSFNDLGYNPDPGVNLIAMGKISGEVRTEEEFPPTSVPLSWMRAEATNGTITGACSQALSGQIDRCAATMDGTYDGVGAIFVPGATYNVTISDLAGFCTSATTQISVAWNGNASYSVSLFCEDPPPPSPAPTNLTQPNTYQNQQMMTMDQCPQENQWNRWKFLHQREPGKLKQSA